MAAEQRVALVTGANRGIGFETTRQLAKQGIKVVLGSRDPKKGEAAAEKLRQEGLDVVAHQLSVTDSGGIKILAELLESEFGRVDILVNNAGILPDAHDGSILSIDVGPIREAMETNAYAPILLAQSFVPLMKQQGYGRIVNVSSGMGQLSDMGGGHTAYRLSKVSLNAITRILANELEGTNIKVNSVCPGWVKTDMGGTGATRSPEQGADTVVWLATLPDDAPSGLFWRDRSPIPW
ncbi:SDR family oxidoreductase [Pseudanabaena sp. FACHB-2040]|uniref:SDR family oxidoreductase n=1 Tax=Pseudanabaena sp. FACHB-2040 TaxID=2692859 RepID=UPI0016845822|nr:SDR family oxidoreductase [Pseudanabaena sp. FACHB-2040]MBD2258548.1 SDR family oxidoreductase [Pseudanabaena sp. FACHB-2040]